MQFTEAINNKSKWQESPWFWLWLLIGMSAAIGLCWDGVELMYRYWIGRDEYSHGILIPFIAAYLIWQKRHQLSHLPYCGAWFGVALTSFGLIVFYAGE
ncbi:MAG: archaeosortase/exosortase family protein, partial [Prosthecobacter sp.]|nr:archaeosortase/exosortase family protein [Prosthecobacter sp.]